MPPEKSINKLIARSIKSGTTADTNCDELQTRTSDIRAELDSVIRMALHGKRENISRVPIFEKGRWMSGLREALQSELHVDRVAHDCHNLGQAALNGDDWLSLYTTLAQVDNSVAE